MKKQKVIPISFDTYIAIIKNSVGSKMFRNSYAKVNGKKTDILKNGEFSCAFYVSSILILFKLINEIHATVNGAIRDLKQLGWSASGWKKPKIGSVIVWEENHNFHKHIGFYIGDNQAISNDKNKKTPIIHHWTYGTKNGKPVRKIINMYWSNKLKQYDKNEN